MELVQVFEAFQNQFLEMFLAFLPKAFGVLAIFIAIRFTIKGIAAYSRLSSLESAIERDYGEWADLSDSYGIDPDFTNDFLLDQAADGDEAAAEALDKRMNKNTRLWQ